MTVKENLNRTTENKVVWQLCQKTTFKHFLVIILLRLNARLHITFDKGINQVSWFLVQASDPKNQSGCNRNIRILMQYVDKMLTLWARGHRSKHPLGRNVSMLVDMARINVCGLPLYLLVIQQSGHSVQHHNTRHKTHIWFTKADLMHLYFLPFCPFTVLSYL